MYEYFQGGYDLTVGTSERGDSVDDVQELKPFNHLLIALGGLKGLEAGIEADEELYDKQEDEDFQSRPDPRPLFDLYLNTCPDQGSRTIRTEEALLVTLSALRPKIIRNDGGR